VAYVFDAELWRWDARQGDSWIFVSLPADASDEIGDLVEGRTNGFGSVRVTAAIGTSTWQTSIFPDGVRKCYALPVKKAVRRSEGLEPGDTAHVTVELRDFP
jgi:hypothetical protein